MLQDGHIVLVPKNAKVTELNDYRLIALTSVIMKCFERLVKDHITSNLPDTLDPHQFAYCPNRSTDDAIAITLHTALSQLDKQQRLFNLRRLKKFGLSSKTFTNFYSYLVLQLHRTQTEGSPEGSASSQRQQSGGQTTQITALQDTSSTRCHRKDKKIIKENNHLSHCLFTPLSSRRRGQYRCIKAGAERLKNSFYLKAIRLLNSHH
jgi:hypothetical protein